MGLYLAYDSAQQPPAAAPAGMKKKLLIAIRPEDVALSRNIVGDEFDFQFCHTFREACDAVDETVGLVVCGVHFDSGKVFDFLRHVRENPDTAHLPFFILLGAGSRYSPAIVTGIKAAAKLLKVTGFTDLTRFADKIGKDAAFDALRKGIRDALAEQEKRPAARPSSR
ncbi:MAG TPA: hypothetical protein VEC35_16685 [Noviherbaspirillum sp.]|nr:hypothetical protein [Noviherbaspirillum sp.]